MTRVFRSQVMWTSDALPLSSSKLLSINSYSVSGTVHLRLRVASRILAVGTAFT
jgi:hypothetical protein